MTGYLHRSYAASLSEFGEPVELPRCGGWVLRRAIPGRPDHDAMGCYPLFACRDWSQLGADLESLQGRLVSLTLVADPFGCRREQLAESFDVVVPFKRHFVADLERPAPSIPSRHHARYARLAARRLTVEVCPDPVVLRDEWLALYAQLVERRGIRGLPALSRKALAAQLEVPGIVMFRAAQGTATAGLDLWYVQGDVAYGHLVALSPLGYRTRASYALKWSVLEYFAGRVRWLDLGGAPGLQDGEDGLTRFKQGWATGTRTAYLCGRVLDRERYAYIASGSGTASTTYFPAYRDGEFGPSEVPAPCTRST